MKAISYIELIQHRPHPIQVSISRLLPSSFLPTRNHVYTCSHRPVTPQSHTKMESLVSVHNSNKSDLLALSSTIASPPAASTSAPTINPLLSRIKLKAKPKKLKKKVEAIKASELKVVSTAIGHTDVGLQGEVEGEEQVVLDLADELLDMLDEQEANDGGGQGQLNEPNDQGKGLLGGGARISIAAGGDKKLSRQALRKVRAQTNDYRLDFGSS